MTNIVQSTLNVPLTTKKLNTKIEYLSKDKQYAEYYISDLEYSLKLNKSVLGILQNPNKQPDYLESILESMERYNLIFKKRLEIEKETKEKALRQCVIKEYQRKAQQDFFEARIQELDVRAYELRKLMHEKEVAFAKIIERLNQYEEMEEETLKEKLDSIDFTYEYGFTKKIIAKLTGEKLKLQKEATLAKRELEQYKMERYKIKKALSSRMNFYRFRYTLLNSDSRIVNSLIEATNEYPMYKAQKAYEIYRAIYKEFSTNPTKLSKYIVKLIKKEKLANDILYRYFKYSVELNEEIINWNKVLSQGNKNMQHRLKTMRAKIIIMYEKLKDYERHFVRLRKCRSYRELVCKYTNFIDENPRKTYIEALVKEVYDIDVYNVPELTTEKAYSAHNIYGRDEEEFEQMISYIVYF